MANKWRVTLRSTHPAFSYINYETIILIDLLILLAAFPPMSIDMYLPAIPRLQEQWNIPLSLINLSLSLFFIGFSAGILIYGPLSDRMGRRPILLKLDNQVFFRLTEFIENFQTGNFIVGQ